MKKNLAGVAVMTAICAVSGGGLAALKDVTAPRIEQQVLTYVQAPTLKVLFPSAENDLLADRKTFSLPDPQNPDKSDNVMVFPVMRDGKLAAVALENFAPGYGGEVGMMVAVDVNSDSIIAVRVTAMKETPGIGARIAEGRFLRQFAGASDAALKSAGGRIDALSGATVSSTAAVNAVQAALQQYAALKDEIRKTWQ